MAFQFGPSLFSPPPVIDSEDDAQPTITIVDCTGSHLFSPPPLQSGVDFQSCTPRPGDSTTPNNHLPLDTCNPFVATASLTLGTATNKNVSVLPTSIHLTALVSTPQGADDTTQLLYNLRVSFENKLGETAAAVLSVPRLPKLLLLEEEHVVGDIRYEPRVEEKELATEQYEAAANSSHQTSTLSDASDDAYHIKLDKIPASGKGTFGLTFIQIGGLKTRAIVEEHACTTNNTATKKRSIGDLTILPGFTCRDCPHGGVPIDFELVLLGKGLSVMLPTADVILEDQNEVTGAKKDILSIIRLGPGAGNVGRSRVRWKNLTGLAQGTLLKVRVAKEVTDNLTEEIKRLSIHDAVVNADVLSPVIKKVDTINAILFEPSSGAKCDSTLVDVAVPFALPAELSRPVQKEHHIYVIVDTSGSTSLRTGEGGQMFLSTAKTLLQGILRDLPGRINGLREQGAISASRPVSVKLWSFDSDTRFEAETTIAPNAIEDASALLQCKVQSFKPGGRTNYDSWSDHLLTEVSQQPEVLHSVLLVTDGGATSHGRFFSSIDSISQKAASFQVDCLGYGPWLDPECVSFLAARTGGEAVMVESLTGSGTAEKIVGLLSASLIRAASRINLRIDGAKLLAVATPDSVEAESKCSKAHEVTVVPYNRISVRPGQVVQLLLLHPSGTQPQLSIHCEATGLGEKECSMLVPWPLRTALPEQWIESQGAEGWEVVESSEAAGSPASPSPLLARLSKPNLCPVLRHLSVLEPAYSTPGSVHFPPSNELDRRNVTLHTSLLGQVVAPSVTKGIAVATLQNKLKPVPEHCRPEPWSICKRYTGSLTFKDEDWPMWGSCFGSSPGGALKTYRKKSKKRKTSGGSGDRRGGGTRPSGFSITKPSYPEPVVPGIVGWIKTTRGGLFPAEAERMKQQANNSATRLTRKTLESKLQADVDHFIGELLNGSSPFAPFISLEAVALRDIECCMALSNRDGTGKSASYEGWVAANKTDLAALTSALFFAASMLGLPLVAPVSDTDKILLCEHKAWPWEDNHVEPTMKGSVTTSTKSMKTAQLGRKIAHPTNIKELVSRNVHASMFTPAVRRDIYRVLLNPDHPDMGAMPREEADTALSEFRAALVANESADKSPDTFVFIDRSDDSVPEGFAILDDAVVNDGIQNIGKTHPTALALTYAFEDYLTEKAKTWGDQEANSLSVEFCTAFSNELTPRLDMHHRIKSSKLSPEEIQTLSTEPFARFINQEWLQTFQGPFKNLQTLFEEPY